jgi:hypothetical protein
MYAVLQSLNTQFASSQNIIDQVGQNCSFLMEVQDQVDAFISYNLRESDRVTKEGHRNYELVVAIVAPTVTKLFQIYDAVRAVIDTETTDFYSEFTGSGYPEPVSELDDKYLLELNYDISSNQ